ncbi:unnamed protein product [Cunninghamella blakesleeana]
MKGKYEETAASKSNSIQNNNNIKVKSHNRSRLVTFDDSKSKSYSKNGSTKPICIQSKEELFLPPRQSKIMNSYSSIERKRQNSTSLLSKRKSPRLLEKICTTASSKHNQNQRINNFNSISSMEDEAIIILSPEQTVNSKFNGQDDEKYNKSALNTNKRVSIPSKLEYSDKKLQDSSIDSDDNSNYGLESNISIRSTLNNTNKEDLFSAHSPPKSTTHNEQKTNKSTLTFLNDNSNNNNENNKNNNNDNDNDNDNKKPTSPKASTAEISMTEADEFPLNTENEMELCISNTTSPINESQHHQLRKKKNQRKIKWSHDEYYKDCTGLSSPSASDNELTNDIHVFNSFFYTRITQTRTRVISEEIYTAVQNWTSGIDLFSKKFLIIPVNEDNHWYLVLVCNPGLCIPKEQHLNLDQDEMLSEKPTSKEKSTLYILDSLRGKHDKCVKNVTKYLCLEANYKHKIEYADFIKPIIKHPLVPRQDNVFDCGIYLLHFVELFMKSTQQFIETLENNDPYDYFWKKNDLTHKRENILSLFDQLKTKKKN